MYVHNKVELKNQDSRPKNDIFHSYILGRNGGNWSLDGGELKGYTKVVLKLF